MARERHTLSDETYKVLNGYEAEFAAEADKDVSYFNKIKNGHEPDRFAQFYPLFKVGCRTHAPVEIWLNLFNSYYVHTRRLFLPLTDLSGKVLEKIDGDGETLKAIFDSTKDDHLDKAECHRILATLSINNRTNQQIEEIVLAQLGKLDGAEEGRRQAATASHNERF